LTQRLHIILPQWFASGQLEASQQTSSSSTTTLPNGSTSQTQLLPPPPPPPSGPVNSRWVKRCCLM
jgi:hypothetical protein